jgi:hypothetical protein
MGRCSLIALALLVMACEPVAASGASCARPADCTAPLTCASGRCRVQCRDHRDCPIASRCIVGNDGLGVCTIEDDRCESSSECGEDFECRSGACFDACPRGTCPAGGVCMGGVCAREEPGVDGGTIDADLDGGPIVLAAHVRCLTDAECGSNRVCARILGGAYACRDVCTTSAECGAPGTNGVCGFFDGVDEAEVLACTVPCELFAQTGCLEGEACDVLEISTPSGANGLGVECRPIDPAMRVQEETCASGDVGEPTLCAAGFDCDGTPPAYACQQLCTVGGVFGDPCPAGLTCTAFGLPARFRDATVGSCDPG